MVINNRLNFIESLLVEIREGDQEKTNKRIINEIDNEELLTKKEAARLLKVSVSTIANYGRSGVLKKHYIGRSVRFKKDDVLAIASPTKRG